MFTKSKNKKTSPNTPLDPNARNLIAAGTTIIGEIKSDGVIRLDGNLKGDLVTKGKLVVGQTGSIIGNVQCSSADIAGSMKGKIVVSDLLSLKATARVEGEVFTSKLSIDPGAIFTVTCDMTAGSGGGTSQLNEKAEKKAR